MKNIFIFGLLVFLIANVPVAQIPSCSIPSILTEEYGADINNLTLRRMYDVGTADVSSIEIPQIWQDTIAEGLAAIFNSTSMPARDTVFNMYCIHDNTGGPERVYQQYLIRVDTTYAWTNAWQNLISLTGDVYIDNLVNTYGLSVIQFYNWSIGDYAIVSTDQVLNPYALINTLEESAGILSGEPDAIVGGANKIMYEKTGDFRYYDFYVEFNDCFDGCDNYRKWSFKVNPDCSVDYLGSEDWGFLGVEPLPAPLNCNTFVTVVDEVIDGEKILIYPNPFLDYLTINLEGKLDKSTYCILDQTGRVVLNGELTHLATIIDVSQLSKGLYVIQINQGDVMSFKLIKE